MSALMLPDNFSNPMAQNWRLPNFEAPNVRVRFEYGTPFTVPNATTIFNQVIAIRANSDFLCRELAFDIGAAVAGSITVRFKDNQGRRMSQDMLAVEELQGPIPLPWLLPRQQAIYIDIANSGAAPISVQPILKGVEQFQRLGINTCMPGFEPESYVPLYRRYSLPPAGWHDEPYDYYFEVAATALQSRTGLPLAMDGDADTYIRGITGYNNAADGTGLLKVRVLDPWQNGLSSELILQANEVGAAPQARPIYPEICAPAYSSLAIDATEYTNNACKLRFALRTVKRYRD